MQVKQPRPTIAEPSAQIGSPQSQHSPFGGLQAFLKRSLECCARLSGVALHVKRDVFRDRDGDEARARLSSRRAAHGRGSRAALNGSNASKSSTVFAFGN